MGAVLKFEEKITSGLACAFPGNPSSAARNLVDR